MDVYDFYKPGDKITPIVDGRYSIDCYLEAMKGAYDNVKSQLRDYYPEIDGQAVTDDFYFVFHTPFPSMAKKAGAFLLVHEMRNKAIMKEIISRIGPEPAKKTDEYNRWLKMFMSTDKFSEFWKKIELSIEASKYVGNIYTGSLFLGFLSLLEQAYEKGIELSGKKIAFGGYGSGAAACAYFGSVQPQWKNAISHDLATQLKNALCLSYDEYTKLHSWHTKHVLLNEKIEVKSMVDNNNSIDKGKFHLIKIDRGKRIYQQR